MVEQAFSIIPRVIPKWSQVTNSSQQCIIYFQIVLNSQISILPCQICTKSCQLATFGVANWQLLSKKVLFGWIKCYFLFKSCQLATFFSKFKFVWPKISHKSCQLATFSKNLFFGHKIYIFYFKSCQLATFILPIGNFLTYFRYLTRQNTKIAI